MKIRGVACQSRVGRSLVATWKICYLSKLMIHGRNYGNHAEVIDTAPQKSIIGIGVWGVIKHCNIWIYDHCVYMSGRLKGG